MVSLPCTLVSSSKHVSKLSPEKATNLHVGTETTGRTRKVLVHYSNRYHPDRYRIRCPMVVSLSRTTLFRFLPHLSYRGSGSLIRNLAMITTVVIITYLSYHRAGSQVHCPQRLIRNSTQPCSADYDFIDESLLSVRLVS